MKRGQFGPECRATRLHGSSSNGGSLCVYGPILRSFRSPAAERLHARRDSRRHDVDLDSHDRRGHGFGGVGDGISKSRRALEQFDRLRTAAQQLSLDLQGVTVNAGRPPGAAGGESRVFRVYRRRHSKLPQAINAEHTAGTRSVEFVIRPLDLTVGERGDILMFTTRNAARPFLGRYHSALIRLTLRFNPTWPRWPGFSAADVAPSRLAGSLGVNQNLEFRQSPPEDVFPTTIFRFVLRTANRGQQLGRSDQAESLRDPVLTTFFPSTPALGTSPGLPTSAECHRLIASILDGHLGEWHHPPAPS